MSFKHNLVSLILASLVLVSVDANSPSGNSNVGYSSYDYNQGRQQAYYDQYQQGIYQNSNRQHQESEIGNELTEQSPLPEQWSEHFDPESGQYYYYNSEDGTTTWDRPIPELSSTDVLKEAEVSEDIDQGQSQTPEEGMDVSHLQKEHADLQDVDGQENQRSTSHEQNTWATPQGKTESENVSDRNWGRIGEHSGMENDPVYPAFKDEEAAKNAENQNWHAQDMELQNANQGPATSGVAKKMASLSPDSDEEQQQLSGWGLPNRQSRPQSTQQSGPRQQRSGWDDTSRLEDATEQQTAVERGFPDRQLPVDRDDQPQWTTQGLRREIRGMQNQEKRQARPPVGQSFSSGPERMPPKMTDSPRHHYQYAGENGMRGAQPPQPRQESSRIHRQPSYEHHRPPSGQAPPQNQRPPYGVGHGTHFNQPPAPFYSRQYQQYENPQHVGFNNRQRQLYGQQQQGRQVAQSAADDSTVAVKEALGKSWQGLLGFSNRTREAMEQARDQVVASASVASQSLSEKSTSLWGQAKSALGSVFEKNEDSSQAPYSLSNSYSGRPQPGYPGASQQSQNRGYPPPYPGRYSAPSRQGLEQQKMGQDGLHPALQQQYPQEREQPGNPRLQIGGPRMQPRGDVPYPHQSQLGQAPRVPHQAQHGGPGRYNGGNQPPRPDPQRQQGPPPSPRRQPEPKDRIVRQQPNLQPPHLTPHPDPWSHPGLSNE